MKRFLLIVSTVAALLVLFVVFYARPRQPVVAGGVLSAPAPKPAPVVLVEPTVAPKQAEKVEPPPVYDNSVPPSREVGERIGLIRSEAFHDSGRATLADAVASQVWAMSTGNTEYLAGCLRLDEVARKKVEALRENASPALRGQSTEAFAAFLLTSTIPPIKGFLPLRQESASPDAASVHVFLLPEGESNYRSQKMNFEKGSDGTWYRTIDPMMVKQWTEKFGPAGAIGSASIR